MFEGTAHKTPLNTVASLKVLSTPNVTQLNSTKATLKQLRWVRQSTHLEPTPPTPPQTFQALLDQLES